jgi:hypothetical protein
VFCADFENSAVQAQISTGISTPRAMDSAAGMRVRGELSAACAIKPEASR